MNKSDLVAVLQDKLSQFSKEDVEVAVNEIVKAMTSTLAKGERIEIRGFGTFQVHERPGRIGRNPKTGEAVQVSPKTVPHFRAGKELKEALIKYHRNKNSGNNLEQNNDDNH